MQMRRAPSRRSRSSRTGRTSSRGQRVEAPRRGEGPPRRAGAEAERREGWARAYSNEALAGLRTRRSARCSARSCRPRWCCPSAGRTTARRRSRSPARRCLRAASCPARFMAWSRRRRAPRSLQFPRLRDPVALVPVLLAAGLPPGEAVTLPFGGVGTLLAPDAGCASCSRAGPARLSGRGRRGRGACGRRAPASGCLTFAFLETMVRSACCAGRWRGRPEPATPLDDGESFENLVERGGALRREVGAWLWSRRNWSRRGLSARLGDGDDAGAEEVAVGWWLVLAGGAWGCWLSAGGGFLTWTMKWYERRKVGRRRAPARRATTLRPWLAAASRVDGRPRCGVVQLVEKVML